MTSMDRSSKIEMTPSGQDRLYRLSGTAAGLAGALLLAACVELIARGAVKGLATPMLENWLVVIFKIHAGLGGLQIDKLQTFNFLDAGILAIVAVMYVGLYASLRGTSRIWSVIALIQPFLGIALFVATKSAGRSSIMGAGLVISAVMMRGGMFNKAIGLAGLLASALLLAGDLSAGAIPPSGLVAALFGIGYMLLIAWLFLVGRRLFQAGGLSAEKRRTIW